MAAEVIKFYQDENVEPLQNMTRYVSIDFKLLASALAARVYYPQVMLFRQSDPITS